jgi:hypothetical protein
MTSLHDLRGRVRAARKRWRRSIRDDMRLQTSASALVLWRADCDVRLCVRRLAASCVLRRGCLL